MARDPGLFQRIFRRKGVPDSDAVLRAKAKQKAEAEERGEAAKRALRVKVPQKKSMTPGLPVDGKWGASTTAAIQEALGQPLTGEAWINDSDAKALQHRLGIGVDGLFDKSSSKALQSYLGVDPDGIFGVESVTALQTRLNAGTFFSP